MTCRSGVKNVQYLAVVKALDRDFSFRSRFWTFWRLSNVLNIWTHFPKLLQDLHIEAIKSSSTRLHTTWFTSSTSFITFCLIVIFLGRGNSWLQLMHRLTSLISAVTPYMYEANGKLTRFSFSSLGTFYFIQLLPLYLLLRFIAYPRKCLWNGS